MINIEITELKKAIKEKYPFYNDSVVEQHAKTIVETTDERLEENVKQWMNNETITDMWIGKYCINAIMSIRNDNDFLDALDAMNIYLIDETAGVQRIWRAKK